MTEGTRSLLIGCHSFIMHPLMVIKAWHWWFGRWPRPWQIICIFIHDWGIAGRDYLTWKYAKVGHWRCGAHLAYKFFGQKGFDFCAGHTPESTRAFADIKRSDLWYADKASWLVAPIWWLKLNYIFDISNNGRNKVSSPWEFKLWIAQNLKEDLLNGNHFSCHQKFIEDHHTEVNRV